MNYFLTKRQSRLLPILLAVCLVATMFTGCQRTKPEDTTPSTEDNLPGNLVEVKPTEEATVPTETTEPVNENLATVKDQLTVRSSPSTGAKIIGYLDPGTEVEIIKTETYMGVEWALIREGWIVLDYVEMNNGSTTTDPDVDTPTPTEPKPTEPKPTEPKPTEPAPTEPKPTEPKPTEPKPTEPAPTEPKPTEPETTKPQLIYGAGFVTASGGLRLRAQATTNSAILDTAQRNEVVVVLSKEGDWYKVNYNLQEGYMHSDYVSVLTRENAELGYGQFLENSKVYTAVDPTSKVLDTANKDEKAYIIGVNTGWYKVIFKDVIGYVPSNVLKLTEVPYENHDSENYPRFFRLGKSTGLAPSADALKEEVLIPSTDGEKIVATAKKYLGVPYVWGGASPSGFDCSGLVYYVFKVNGYSMYRTPEDQYRQGTYVSRNNLQPGDVVFFYNTVPGTGISHVGIYIGDGQFIHSPNSRSVVSIARLDNTYWNQHYYGARRMSK